ncbi:PilZ domain-containing protein [Pseudomonas mangiferae]|uniref:PilZ domain-containing protein n=1 Tax=Pseudomonas mangiferae TaxID=2593654 RepID=A0A553GZU1_9PSED|nr:PilZ domain-containing protein [Pseudomonas mangiferae]TRX74996.1 PilZ domain-containing protein [Pseudomonas mangiferae]
MSQNDRTYSEKRDFIRMQVETTVVLYHAGQEIPGKSLNLSSTGMQLEVKASVEIGEKVRVHIPSEHAELPGLEAEAEVVRSADLGDGLHSLGLAFVKVS